MNSLSVDVEEYFHPEEVRKAVPDHRWSSLPSRVEAQVDRVLELLDRGGAKGTFFILGWVAETHPHLVRKIAAQGHEIGCHSYAHRLIYNMTPAEFRADTRRAVSVIEDACGISPVSYRAPSYSITEKSKWALEILVENGFTHDSSIYPIPHDRYGIPGFYRHAEVIATPAGPIQEVPIGTVRVGPIAATPIGGGGYLRLLPYRYTAAGIRRVNRVERKPVCIYFHPWELDMEQPRVASSLISRWRTYYGLDTMGPKIERLLSEFHFAPLNQVYPATFLPATKPARISLHAAVPA
ncbi:MAG: DUF3473 domain-containing protein [Bryobacterales bacterium]|nr:DUF3473 domain-containing protein [Bryobacterales bacterium]